MISDVKPLYIFFGMKRCGQHAVINWICKQHGGSILFKNNCNLLGHGRGELTIYKGGEEYGAWGFEDASVDLIRKALRSNRFKGAKPVMIVRDPFNWVASSLHRTKLYKSPIERSVATYLPERIQIYKEYFNNPIEGMLVVNFNKWFIDRFYRENLCKQLNITFTDEGKNEVPKRGSGSSFDKRKFNGKAEQMKVLDRWKTYKNDPEYWKIFEDAELNEIGFRYFGIGVRSCPKQKQ
jgi:hypothetical protein